MSQGYATIDGFEKLSRQELFDMSLAHVRKNGKPSLAPLYEGSHSSVCVYSGIGCAAAPFLKPERREACDGLGSWDALVEPEVCGQTTYSETSLAVAPPHEQALIRQIQQCHDNTPRGSTFLPSFNQRMRELAQREGLVYSPE